MDVFPNYIAGEWSQGEAVRESMNPSDLGDMVGCCAYADASQCETAIMAARTAFPEWSRSPLQSRVDALDGIGVEILARKEELGRLLAREEGKTLAEAIGEVTRAGQIFRFFAGEAVRIPGERLASLRPGIELEVTREPIGVVGIIAPWNFPIAIPAWKIAPAIAFGNCVVFKPADNTPATAWALAEIISRAGLPEGVFNLVMGRGSVVGDVLIHHPEVDGITFTGSSETGMRVAQACVERRAKVQLEMGGKNPLVILDDADLDNAVRCALDGAFFCTGQRCTASSRLVVTEAIHDRFVSALVESMKRLSVGHALAEGTDIGPVVDEAQLSQDLAYLEIGEKEGARLAYGGERLDCGKDGYYLQPALFVDTDNGMRINREEIFGPIASVIRVRDYDEALSVANDTDFGLVAGICTGSLKHASHFKRNVESGTVVVNLPTAGGDYHVPFGGRKASNYGSREQGRYAVEFYTVVKTAYSKP